MAVEKELAETIFRDYTDGIVPVDMEKLYAALGIRIELSDTDVVHSSALVELDETYSDMKKRFVLAHMLGHIKLGHTLPVEETKTSYLSGSINKEELSANIFALNLLIPETTFDMYVRKLGYENVEKIAEICGVSVSAIKAKFTIDGVV